MERSFDPSGALERLGADVPHLLAARGRTREEVAGRRKALAGVALDAAASVVLFGSWGRQELTPGSDDDWALLVRGAARPGLEPAAEAVRTVLGGGERRPGRTGVFGGPVFCD